jgi:hypothetical protein
LAVGASSDNNGLGNSGSVYIFDRVGQQWMETQELSASDAQVGDVFGLSLAGSPTRLAIGSLNTDGSKGAVYVFELVQGIWTETAKLRPTLVSASDGFAIKIAMDGDVILASAHGSGGPFPRGAAWVMEWDGSAWSGGQKLTASDGQNSDGLGDSVALSGLTAVVGAACDDDAFSDQGSAYVFEKIGATWTEVAKLQASDAEENARFGGAVAVQGDLILVGANGHGTGASQSGAVYGFEKNLDGTWGPHETYSYAASDPENSTSFGKDLAIDGDRFVATSIGRDFGGSTGNAHVFERSQTGWEHVAKILASDAGQSILFGGSVAISGDLVLAGALGTDEADENDIGCNSGSAYLFEFPDNTVTYGFGQGCPCGNDDPDRGCVNSRGLGSVLAPCGTTSVGADDLVLKAAFVPQNQFGIAFMGGAQVSAPFGDGQRRVGAGGVGIHRYLPILNAGAEGTITLGPGLVARSQSFPVGGHIDPGETWNFQLWYRDPMGSPCGARFNLTNGVAVSFVP